MIAQALGGLFAATTLNPIHPRDPAIAKMLGVGMTTSSGIKIDEGRALTQPAFRRGVQLISDGVARAGLYVYKRNAKDGREEDRSHPAFKLLSDMADSERWLGPRAFRRAMMHNVLLWGNACAYISRDDLGRPTSLSILPPSRMSMAYGELSERGFKFDLEGQKYYALVTPNGRTRYYEADKILHIKGLSPDGEWGYNVVDQLRDSIGVGVAARDFGARFFGQGGVASGLLFMPPGMSDEQQTEFIRAIREGHQGLGNAHKFLVLDSEAKFQQMTIPQEHAQFLETRVFENKEIALILGVQPHKLGDSARTSYASLEQANQEHLDDTLDPHFIEWEEECGIKLLTERERETHYCEFNRESLMRMDHAAKTSSFTAGRNGGWYSVNEIRKMQNMPPIPNGDVYLSPLNMAPSDGNVIETNQQQQDESNDDPLAKVDLRHLGNTPSKSKEETVAELAGHIVRKLCNRVAKDAKHAAQAGGAKYLAFIESIAELGDGPQSIRGVMTTATNYLKTELNAYAEPPYSASSLANNVTANADRIADEAFNAGLAALGK